MARNLLHALREVDGFQNFLLILRLDVHVGGREIGERGGRGGRLEGGEQLRRGGVDRPRKFALDFTAVHEVVGGGIDDGVRLQFREPARHQISLGDVKLSVAGKEKLKIRRRDFLERVRQQTIAACDEYVFHNRSSREA